MNIPQLGKSKARKKEKECQAGVYEELRWHSFGVFPKRLVSDFRTNEDEKDLKQRKEIHQPITTNDFTRCIQGALETIKNSEYSMSEINDNTREVANVILEELDDLFHKGIVDPNGLYAILPKDVFSYDVDADLNAATFELECYFFHFDQIEHTEDGVIVLEHRPKKNEEIKKLLLTNSEIILISDKEYSSIYEHQFGFIPIFEPHGVKGDHCKNSLAYPFIPEGNIALQLFSDWLLGVIRNNYSTEVRRELECVACDGEGRIVDPHLTESYGRELKTVCKVCNGKGRIIEANPSGVIIIPDSNNAASQEINPKDFAAFIERPIEPVKYTDEKWREALDGAIKNISPPKAKVSAESGESIKQQRKNYETWVQTLGNFYFYIIENVTNIVDTYINVPQSRKELTITSPKTYDSLDAEGKVLEIEQLIKQGSSFIARSKYQDFIEHEYKEDPIKLKSAKLLPKFDVLFFSNDETLLQKKAAGVVTDRQCQKHEFSSIIFMELEEREDYLEWSDERTLQEANSLFNTLAPPVNTLI